ncbi:hypothetical protein D1872_225860 [compost metagenome]
MPHRKLFPSIARVLQCFPAGFNEQPFLRVHTECFPWRNIEKQRIEFCKTFDKAPPLAVAFCIHHRFLWIRMEEPFQRPTLTRDFGDTVLPCF